MRKLFPVVLVLVLLLVIGADTRAGSQARAGLPYKVYVALLTQTGTDAPVATVQQNTLGGSVDWSYSATGRYIATLAGALPASKTVAFLSGANSTSNPSGAFIEYGPPDTIQLNTFKADGSSNQDGSLNSASIEIRVYP